MRLSRRYALSGAAVAATFARHARAVTPTIRIGVLTDLSGQYRDNSGPTTVLAAKQAVEDFNPSAHGFTVEVIAADHQQKPDVGAGIARQWFDRDGVDIVADVNNTAIALAVGRVASEKNKALLITGAASVDLTGKYCNPHAVHYAPDTWFGPHMTGSAVLKDSGKDWYLIIADYTFGHSLEDQVTKLVTANGGRVLGASAYPFPGTTDYSSYLLAAQASGAHVIGLCNVGGDMENCVKQAAEFNLAKQGVRMAALLGFITEAKSMGLETAQGLLLPGIFYWDLNDRTRSFTRRFLPKTPDNYPSDLHAACYSATLGGWAMSVASQPWAELPKVLELAKRPNAVIKVSGACTLSREPYPFPDIWDPLARIFNAWGFERCLWGTDWTRAFAVVNYEQAVEPFLNTDRLSDAERAMLMGGACAKAYGWTPREA